MRYAPDTLPRAIAERTETVNRLVDEMYICAQAVEMAPEGQAIDYRLFHRIEQLEEDLRALGEIPIVFSGEGFVPCVFPDGNEDTIYSSVELQSGVFTAFEIADAEVIEYFAEEDLDEALEADAGSLLHDKANDEEVRSRLLEPPSGTQLYIELLVHDTDFETALKGPSIRSKGLAYYAMMHAARFEFHDFADTNRAISTEESVIGDLHRASREVYRLLKSTELRRMPVARQKQLVDQAIARVDRKIKIDRFSIMVHPSEMLSVDTADGNRRVAQVAPADFPYSISATPLKLDSLETFELQNNQAIRSDSQLSNIKNSGLCIVADIGPAMQENYGLASPIVWIPVVFPSKRRWGVVPGFDAYIEQLSD